MVTELISGRANGFRLLARTASLGSSRGAQATPVLSSTDASLFPEGTYQDDHC
jgi:hypothetical protein